MLEVTDLSIGFGPGECLLEGVSFRVEAGGVLALLGPSGSGKSTVLDWLTGTLAPGIQARGQLHLNGRDLSGVPTEQRGLGLVLQDGSLFPHMSVADNLRFGAREPLNAQAMDALLNQADLGGMADRDPATLSGGQRARVSLLRTLVSQPQAVLLDEPFAKLDAELRDQIRAFTWQHTAAVPRVLVTHDAQDIPPGAQRIQLGDAAC
ncbi:ATP-binding cassette domain-containing protein [Litorivicinus lipolyticus]|uniref:ATP-binding cassette domain-containing protein n=1 Tax=Litorivicinus lipolyticus TaxID=418701 RepID=UPI003B5CB9CE